MRKMQDLKGKRFGRLVVKSFDGIKNGAYYWICKCDCGNEKSICSCHFKYGKTNSCGCYNKELISKRTTKHHLTNTRLFKIWRGMIDRCYYKTHKYYKNYGGRGIDICKEWKDDFKSFYDWAIKNGYNENAKRGKCTIDRIDNNKGYFPENCRWVDMYVQQNNTRKTKKVWYNNVNITLEELSKLCGISKSILYKRLYKGWSIERATTQKIKECKEKVGL